jgi:tape measure domain-containing protein
LADPSVGDVVLGIRLDDAALFAGLAEARRRVEGGDPIDIPFSVPKTIPAPVVPPITFPITPPPSGLFGAINADMDDFRVRAGRVQTAWNEFIGSFSGAAVIIGAIGLGVLASDIAKTGTESQQSKLAFNALTSTYGETGRATESLARVQGVLGISGVQAREDFNGLYASLRGGGITLEQTEVLLVGVQKAARLSGASAEEAAGAFIQLKQGLASGRLAGDELRSVLEQMPLLAQAIAQQLGVPIGALRDLGAEGKITTDTIYKAVADLAGREVPGFTAAQQMAVQWENLKESIAEALGPTFNSLGTTAAALMATLANYFRENADEVGKMAQMVLSAIQSFAPFAEAILAVVAAYNLYQIAAKAVAVAQAAVLALQGPAGWAALAAGAVAAAIAYAKIEEVSKGVGTAVSATTTKLKSEIDKQKAAFDSILKNTTAPKGQAILDPQALAKEQAEIRKTVKLIEDLYIVQSKVSNFGGGRGQIFSVSPQMNQEILRFASTLDIAGNKFVQTLVQGAIKTGNELLKAQDAFQKASEKSFNFLTTSAQNQTIQNAANSLAGSVARSPGLDQRTILDELGFSNLQNINQIKYLSPQNFDDPKQLFSLAEQFGGYADANANLLTAQTNNTKALGELSVALGNKPRIDVVVPVGSYVDSNGPTDVRYN